MSQDLIVRKEKDIPDTADSGDIEDVENKLKMYNNSDGDKFQTGIELIHSVSQAVTNEISCKDEMTAKLEVSKDGYTVYGGQKKSLSAKLSDNQSLTVENSTGCELGTEKTELSYGIKASGRYDINDDICIEKSVSGQNKISFDKEEQLKLENTMKADMKVGSQEYNAKLNAEQTSSVKTDGTISDGGKFGGTFRAGALEGGASHGSSTSYSENSKSISEKDEAFAEVRLSDNIKIKQTGSLENKESESVAGNVLTKEHEKNVALKTEIEVGNDAPAALKTAAVVTNLFMGMANKAISSALSDKSKAQVYMLDAGAQPLLLDSGASEQVCMLDAGEQPLLLDSGETEQVHMPDAGAQPLLPDSGEHNIEESEQEIVGYDYYCGIGY